MIHLSNILFTYKKHAAHASSFQLQIEALDIAAGETVAIVGPSGSGKSTLLNLLAGIDQVDKGVCHVAGHALEQMHAEKRRSFRKKNLDFIFQDIALFDYLSVLDNVLLPLRISGAHSARDWQQARTQALALLACVGLEDQANKKPSNMSQGERQRVAICRSLLKLRLMTLACDEKNAQSQAASQAQTPTNYLILADEPTSALDTVNRDLVLETIFSTVRRTKATLVMLTHDTALHEHFDRVIDMRSLNAAEKHGDTRSIPAAPDTDSKPQQMRPSPISRQEKGPLGYYKAIAHFAWRSLVHFRMRSILVLLAVMLTLTLPLVMQVLLRDFKVGLLQRAKEAPLVIGQRGSEMDLVLKLLYFQLDETRSEAGQDITYGDYKQLEKQPDTQYDMIPMHIAHTVKKKYPLIGTDLDYFSRRKLKLKIGALPVYVGDVVLGAKAAHQIAMSENLSDISQLVGREIRSDLTSLHDLSKNLTVNLHITGILQEKASVDDEAVFASLKSSWLVAGLGHGHQAAESKADEDPVIELSGSVRNEVAISAENLRRFHFHGDPATYPLTGILIYPSDQKSSILLQSRVNARSSKLQMLAPVRVIEALIERLFRIQIFFYVLMGMVLVAMVLLLLLMTMLTAKLRHFEGQTLNRLGAPRLIWPSMLVMENLLILCLATLPAGIMTWWIWNQPGIFFQTILKVLR